MKRFTMIMALVLMVAMPTFAERVTSETARRVATTFFNNNGAKSVQLTDISKEAGFNNLYIFNGNTCFVVMAADDCVQPILGYSLTGIFVAENMPSNVRGWLQGYNDEIRSAIEGQMRATAETTQLWKDLMDGNSKAARATTVVAPLIQTKWNQNKFYNSLCPVASGGPQGHAYTGCVATAMAQIMKYWEYPSHGIGSHSYTWNGQTLSADFGSTTYDWENMVNYYDYYFDDNGTAHSLSNPTPAQITAVATLMYHCGISVDMNYGGGSSGANTADVVSALKTYFNYSPAIEYKSKSNNGTNYYTNDEWIAMVKTELNESRPLQYRGQDPNSDSGHSFVCDGYDNNNYFHFNWGWAGHYNGYFSITNLNTGANSSDPGAGNGNYTRDQSAIFGIQPVQCAASEPTNLTYTLSGIQDLTLNWTAASGAVSYNIYRNGNFIGNSTTNSYNEVAPFGNNVYYIRSVDASSNLSLSSNTVVVYIGFQTPIVDDLGASLSGNIVNLTWSAPEWCYPETPSAMLNYGAGNLYYSWTYVYYAHRHLATNLAQYTGKAVYKVSTFIQHSGTYSVYIYTKSTQYDQPDPNYLAFSKTGVPITISGEWYEFNTDEPIILTGTDDLWVVIKQEATGQQYPTPSFNLSEHNTNAFYAGSSSPTSLYDAHSSYNCSWFINTYLTDGTYTYNLYQDGTQIAQGLNQTTYNVTLNNNTAKLFSVKTNYYGGETEGSNKIGFAKGNASLVTLGLSENDQMTVTENSKLTVSGTLSDVNVDNLILENGAQLVNNSTGVQATVKKNINAYSQEGGWYLIASPMVESIIPTVDNGFLANNYDLYTFVQNEDLEWRNVEAGAFNTIDNKTGYLYANSANLTLSLEGTLASSTYATQLAYDANAYFKGFNLIGNPYPCNTYVDKSFYVLNEDGSDFTLGNNPIPPCSAILVQAQGTGESVIFSKTASKIAHSINISVANANMRGNAIIDQARVSFNENDQLVKYKLSDQSCRLYIPQNGQDFAVAFANVEGEMPVNFKATKNGLYTISIETESIDLDYLYLIDNLTGADIDLLATPSYTFEAKTTDYATRFRLMFGNSNEQGTSTSSATFAYINNGNIIINNGGKATLQIVDMMGRVVVEEDAINRISTSEMAPGVYVVHLINGENVRTQKIVIE